MLFVAVGKNSSNTVFLYHVQVDWGHSEKVEVNKIIQTTIDKVGQVGQRPLGARDNDCQSSHQQSYTLKASWLQNINKISQRTKRAKRHVDAPLGICHHVTKRHHQV